LKYETNEPQGNRPLAGSQSQRKATVFDPWDFGILLNTGGLCFHLASYCVTLDRAARFSLYRLWREAICIRHLCDMGLLSIEKAMLNADLAYADVKKDIEEIAYPFVAA
jgi:hypothetical protein